MSKFNYTDNVFSRYIRQKYADDRGFVKCVTCGVTRPWQEMDAGHYVSREHKNTRFDEMNVHPQCPKCNRFKEGLKDEYALYLLDKYGQDVLQELNRRKNVIKKWDKKSLKQLRKNL